MALVLGMLNYGFVLLYGIFLTVGFAGGCNSKKERRMVKCGAPRDSVTSSVTCLASSVLAATRRGQAKPKQRN